MQEHILVSKEVFDHCTCWFCTNLKLENLNYFRWENGSWYLLIRLNSSRDAPILRSIYGLLFPFFHLKSRIFILSASSYPLKHRSHLRQLRSPVWRFLPPVEKIKDSSEDSLSSPRTWEHQKELLCISTSLLLWVEEFFIELPFWLSQNSNALYCIFSSSSCVLPHYWNRPKPETIEAYQLFPRKAPKDNQEVPLDFFQER